MPIEVREQVPEKSVKLIKLGIFGDDSSKIDLAKALDVGRIISRDIGGSDPERMAAPKYVLLKFTLWMKIETFFDNFKLIKFHLNYRVEDYINKHFHGSDVKIEVIKGQSMFEDMYPCLAAVNRAASGVPRHDGRVIWLTYEPEGPIEKTLMLVGKGITYDSGTYYIKSHRFKLISMLVLYRDSIYFFLTSRWS